MPIIHYPGYISKEQAARQYNVQVRTINDWIRKTSKPPKNFYYIRVDGFVYIKDRTAGQIIPPSNISLTGLKWVPRVAHKNKLIPERLYEQIIIGKVSGVAVVDHVFVMADEPELLLFLQTAPKRDTRSLVLKRMSR